MKKIDRKGKYATCVAVLGFVGLSILLATAAVAEPTVPQDYDNQGWKVFDAQKATPPANLTAVAGRRNLARFYELRQYPGSPPRIPHEVNLAFSGNETDCLSCHGKGGFSPEFNAFAPVTPHPENILCYQCHAQVDTRELFIETEWKSIDPPRLGSSALGGSPPIIPHSLQLRENCIACHTGPAAVVEIQVTHAARGDCRQCHAVVIQTTPVKVFKRK